MRSIRKFYKSVTFSLHTCPVYDTESVWSSKAEALQCCQALVATVAYNVAPLDHNPQFDIPDVQALLIQSQYLCLKTHIYQSMYEITDQLPGLLKK